MNTIYIVLVLLLWSPISFLLHNIIHEGSHAVAVKLSGASVKEMWFLPSYKLGYFTFAHIKWVGQLSKNKYIFVLVAPLIGEAIWLAIFVPLAVVSFINGYDMPIKLFLLIEVASSVVDASVWALGWFRNRPHTDGGRIRQLLRK